MRCFPRPGGLCDQDDIDQEARIGRWIAERDWRADGGMPADLFAGMVIRRRLVSLLRRALRDPLCRPIPDGFGGVDDAASPDEVVEDANMLSYRSELLRLDPTSIRGRVWRLVCAGYTQAEVVFLTGLSAKQVDNACVWCYRAAREHREWFDFEGDNDE